MSQDLDALDLGGSVEALDPGGSAISENSGYGGSVDSGLV
jgi:hypothetical protein